MNPHSEKTQAQPASILADAQRLWSELQHLGYDQFQLAALETRRAGESFVTMLIVGIMLAVLLIAVWLGILAVGVLALVGQGVLVSDALLLAIAVNLAFALVLARVLRRNSRFLQWPALTRSLQPVATKQNQRNKT